MVMACVLWFHKDRGLMTYSYGETNASSQSEISHISMSFLPHEQYSITHRFIMKCYEAGIQHLTLNLIYALACTFPWQISSTYT